MDTGNVEEPELVRSYADGTPGRVVSKHPLRIVWIPPTPEEQKKIDEFQAKMWEMVRRHQSASTADRRVT